MAEDPPSDKEQWQTWRPPRGPLTRAAAWVILVVMALCIGAMIVAVVIAAVG